MARRKSDFQVYADYHTYAAIISGKVRGIEALVAGTPWEVVIEGVKNRHFIVSHKRAIDAILADLLASGEPCLS